MVEPSTAQNTIEKRVNSTGLTEAEQTILREAAMQAARKCGWLGPRRKSPKPRQVMRTTAARLDQLQQDLYDLRSGEPTDDVTWLYDNLRLVRTELHALGDGAKFVSKLPQVRTPDHDSIPRVLVLAEALVRASNNRLTEESFSYFVNAVQDVDPLRLFELNGMLTALKIALLEKIAENGRKALEAFQAEGRNAPSYDVGRLITSLRLTGEIDWKEILEQLSVLHKTLSLDPARVYPRMDFESRSYYRQTLAKLAPRTDLGELELAQLALKLAEEAAIADRPGDVLRDRRRHVGYYIVDQIGCEELFHRANYRPSLGSAIQRFFRSYPDEVYIIGIEGLTLITVVALIMSLVRTHGGAGLILSAILLLIPATQAAVELMNNLVTAVLTARILPKFDFAKGVDPDAATIVAIPTLLINEKQIRGLVDDLEVRYLVNRDPNIFFALLTDLPDTSEPAGEYDARVELAMGLIDQLNRKYAGEPHGGFYLFHRHRIYNPREGAWMGWERKRGKLLDLNQLLRKAYDPFPVKTGDMARLGHIRYVLTLDSDTQLPRGTAQRMIGAMAHPLNRPLIDPELRIVTQGYGILQPRVGISVQSATRSRLASIYSGQTGFDIYSRAVSDVYQDLYEEGIFTGKGIYDVDALRAVLENRFPRNALLSHDLIEGAYSRAGLVSDIEVIDDYPSHYSAYNRRKHRWLRGDWQILRWLFNRVPDESRRLVNNPISLVSRWKIADNLRRSLIEPATFLLLVAGWFVLPGGPRFWTIVSLCLLFIPVFARFFFALGRAVLLEAWNTIRDAGVDLLTSLASVLLNIAFLAHQSFVALDAIVRTIVRSTITHSRLLEWETATEAELGIRKRTPVDRYLDWVPILAIPLGIALYERPEAIPYALPFVLAWCFSKLLSLWLNRSPHVDQFALSKDDRRFLRELALRTWRYFAEFSNEKNHWLIPDNVQEQPYRIAERLSPTNLGLLLNARQAALQFGYLTISEFVALTERTLESVSKLPRYFGHLLNWYDNLSMKPIEPLFISSVDSGNYAASLWSLKQGGIEALHQPVFHPRLLEGIADHLAMLPASGGTFTRLRAVVRSRNADRWLTELLQAPDDVPSPAASAKASDKPVEHVWWPSEIRARVEAIREIAKQFAPWHLAEYAGILDLLPELTGVIERLDPSNGDLIYQDIDKKLQTLCAQPGASSSTLALACKLRQELPACRERLLNITDRLNEITRTADRLVREMDFSKVADDRRKLLSVGYDVAKQELAKSCYDLLASESRIASFIAVAKNDIEQENWFRLGRQHTICEGQFSLISWTGTMFEYLMPVIWMRSHPETLLDRSTRAAVRAQELYAKNRRVPWGISEAAYSKTDPDGNYQYAAFGVPGLALNVARAGSLVISPYSSCLAILVNPVSSVQNMRYMAGKKWLSEYGFYESADFTSSRSRPFLPRKGQLVRCWMAHHQGMSLAALCNLIHNMAFQRWFHAEPLVQASELILQERPLRVKPLTDSQPRRVLNFARSTPKGPAAKVSASA